MEELEAESTINLKSKLERILTKKAREIFVEIDRTKLTVKDVKPQDGTNAVSVSDAQTVTVVPTIPTVNTSRRGNERGGNSGETLTKGVRFVLDRENCFLMELRVVEKNDIVLKQFEKEIKQNGDLNSSKS